MLFLSSLITYSQTEIDGIMMSKNNFCTGAIYQYSSWDNYWEGTFKRTNLNLGTVSTKSLAVMGNYGISDKLNPYTKYKKDIVLTLKKDYSFDIYHLAKKHQAMGSFQISLDELFEQLGLPESYRRIGNLKDRVIHPSIDEITANTDIVLTYENVKQGRSVVGFRFTVREKPKPKLIAPERDTSTVDLFCNMSDAQINKYSTILSKLSELSDLSNFPDYPTFALWIAGILRDPKSVREATAKRILEALYQKTDFKP